MGAAMRILSAIALVVGETLISPLAAYASEPSITFSLRTRIGDEKPIERNYMVPFGSSLRAPAAGSLTYLMEVVATADGRAFTKLSLLDALNQPLPRTTNGGPFLRLPAGGVRTISYTVCDDRVIQQESMPKSAARCADLPAMGSSDPRPDGCLECLGAYEGMPRNFTSRARIVPPGTAGDPLMVTGRVLSAEGSPMAGVIVYAFQTDSSGLYPTPAPPRSQFSQSHGTLRAWVRTDTQGRYSFETIEPGTYPDRSEPRHIHMVVIEPGCATYFIEDVHFSDDPLLDKIEPSHRNDIFNGVGGSGVVTRQHDSKTGITFVTRDIHLGVNFQNYSPCTAAKDAPRQ
jgi:protocatechuate 3,4-dioxygenase beta subunit